MAIEDFLEKAASGAFLQDAPPSYDYASGVNKGNYQQTVHSADFLNDMRTFYKERDNLTLSTDDEVRDKFFSDRRWRNFNPEASTYEAFQAQRMTPDQAARLGRGQRVWEAGPNFYQEGGEGLTGLAKNLGVGAFSLTSLIPGGAGGKAALTAIKALPPTASRAKLLSTAARAGFMAGAKTDALTNAAIGFGTDAAIQARNKEIGLQDQYSTAQGLASAGISGVLGGVIGGGIGAGAGALGLRNLQSLAAKTGRPINEIAAAVSSGKFKTAEALERHLTDPINHPSDPANPAGASPEQNQTLSTPADRDAAAAASQTTNTGVVTDPMISKAKTQLEQDIDQLRTHIDSVTDDIHDTEGPYAVQKAIDGTTPEANLSESSKTLLDLRKRMDLARTSLKWSEKRASLVSSTERLQAGDPEGKSSQVQNRIDAINKEIETGDITYGAILRSAANGRPIHDALKESADSQPPTQKEPPATGATQQPQPQQPAAAPEPGAPPTQRFATGVPDGTGAQDIVDEIKIHAASPTSSTYVETLRNLHPSFRSITAEIPEVRPTATPTLTSDGIASALVSNKKEINKLTRRINRGKERQSSGKATPEDIQNLNNDISSLEDSKAAAAELKAHLNKLSETPTIALAEQKAGEQKIPFLYDKVSDSNSPAQNLGYLVESISLPGEDQILYNTDLVGSIINSMPISAASRASLSGAYKTLIKGIADHVYFDIVTDIDIEHSDAMAMIQAKYGDDMAKIVEANLSGADKSKIQSIKVSKEIVGWGALTPAEQTAVNTRAKNYIDRARNRLGMTILSEGQIKSEERRFKEVLVQKIVLEKAGTIKPPPDLVQAGSMAPVEANFGFSPPTGGLRKLDADGEPFIEHPYYGKIFARDIKLDPAGNPVIRSTRSGKTYKERYSAGESALRAFDEMVIENYEYTKSRKPRTQLIKDPIKAKQNAVAVAQIDRIIEGIKESSAVKSMRARLAQAEARISDLEKSNAAPGLRKQAVDDYNALYNDLEGELSVKLLPFFERKKQLTLSTKAEAESSRQQARDAKKGARERVIGKQGALTPERQSEEELSRFIRMRTARDAVLAAEEDAPENFSNSLDNNMAQAEEMHTNLSPDEMNAAYEDAISFNRSEAAKAEMRSQLLEVQEALDATGDTEAAKIRLREILSGKKTTVKSPQPHPDKPAGVKYEPKIVRINGVEVDVRNHFEYKKVSDNQFDINFMGKRVGQTISNADGSMTILNLTSDASTNVFRGASDAALELPRIFWKDVRSAAADGKLAGHLTAEQNSRLYTVDWKQSKTYGRVKRTVPKADEVADPIKLAPVKLDKPNEFLDATAHNYDIPDGHIMAVQLTTGKYSGVTRVENTRGASAQSVGSILGKSSGEKYIVGFVPAGTRSATPEASQAFKPVSVTDEPNVIRTPSEKAPTGSKRENDSAFDGDTGQLIYAKMEKIAIDQDLLPQILRDQNLRTMADVYTKIANNNNINWKAIPTGLEFGKFFVEMQELYKVQKHYAPDGVRLPNTDRITAMKSWQSIMASGGFSELEISTGMDMLRRLSTHDRDLPIISNGTSQGIGFSLPIKTDPEGNRIHFDPKELIGENGESVIPQPVALLHELFHWAYFNILTPADHLDFWTGMAKYYGISDQNMQAIRTGRLEDISGELMNAKVKLSDIARRMPGLDPDHEISSPAEFFANNGAMWAVSNKKINNYALWPRMAKGLVGMFDRAKAIASKFGIRLYKGSEVAGDFDNSLLIDADLMKLYQKILPDGEENFSRYKNLYADHPPTKGPAGATSLAAKQLYDLDQLRLSMSTAMDTSNPVDMSASLKDAAAGTVSFLNRVKLFKNPRYNKIRAELWKAQRDAFTYLYAHNKSLNSIMGDAVMNEAQLEKLRASMQYKPGEGLTVTDLAIDMARSFSDDEHVANLNRLAINLDNMLAKAQKRLRDIIKFNYERLDPDTVTNILPDGELVRRARVFNRGASTARRIATAQRNRQIAKVASAFQISEADLIIDTREVPAQTVADMIPKKNVKDMTQRELADRIKATSGPSREKNDMVAEFLARGNSEPKGKINPDDLTKRPVDLKNLARNAISRGDYARAEEISLAYQFVAERQRPAVTIEDSVARKVLSSSAIDSHGTSDNGIPAQAPTHLADFLTKLTHRDKLFDRNIKEMAYRLFSMMDLSNSLERPNAITASDLTKLTGIPIEDRDNLSSSKALTALRDNLRQIASAMKSEDQHLDAAERMAEFAFRASTSSADVKTISNIIRSLGTEDMKFAQEHPEKWIAEQYRSMITPGEGLDRAPQLERLTDSEINELRNVLLPLHERVTTVFTGLPVQKSIQAMRVFGDQFRPDHHPIVSSLSGRKSPAPLSMAERFVAEHLDALPKQAREAIAATFGTTPAKISGRVAYLLPHMGSRGPAWSSRLAENISPGHIASLDDMIDQSAVAASVGSGPRRRALISEHASMLKEEYENIHLNSHSEDRLSRTLNNIEAHWNAIVELTDGRISSNPKIGAVPHFYKALKTLDLTDSSVYNFADATPNSLSYIVERMVNSGDIKANDASGMIAELGQTFSGRDFLRVVQSSKHGSSPAKFKTTLETLKFDSMRLTEGDLTFINIFNDTNIERLGDVDYTNKAIESVSLDNSENAPAMAGQLLKEIIEAPSNLDVSQTEGVTAVMQRLSVPQALKGPIRRIARKEPIQETDIQAAKDWGLIQLASNSDRLSFVGAHWLSNLISPKKGADGIYERKDIEFAKAFGDIAVALRKLPDAPSAPKDFINKLRFWTDPDKFTPPSHKRISDALRNGTSGIASLTDKTEKNIAELIKSQLLKEHQLITDSGTSVGKIENYFPQVWNVEFIKKNRDSFLQTSKRFFHREIMRGNAPLPADLDRATTEKAEQLFTTLTHDGSGVLTGDELAHYGGINPLLSRILNFSPEDLQEVTPFMVNDLETVLVKYFDKTTHRRVINDRFGVGMHAAKSYARIANEGREAAVSTLMNELKSGTVTRFGDAGVDEKVVVESRVIPAVSSNRNDIEELVDVVIDILGNTKEERQRNKARAEMFLMEAVDPAIRENGEFAKRVDAIVSSLADFGPEGNNITRNESKFMHNVLEIVDRKPIDGSYPSDSVRAFTRGLRTFNSVTLLGYTVLASIPDVAMPLIRSGQFGAFYRGWKQHLTDPAVRQATKNIGTNVGNLVYERMAHLSHDQYSRSNIAFFRAVGLHSWTEMQRNVSAIVGFEAFKHDIAVVSQAIRNGNTSTRDFRIAQRFLQRYGLEHLAQPGAASLESITDIGDNDAVRLAIMKFVNDTIFAPNPNDVPLWAQRPIGQLVFQLKSFPMMMMRLSGYLIDEARKGNPLPLVYLLTFGVGAGGAAISTRDLVQSRGGEENDSIALRNRNLSENTTYLYSLLGKIGLQPDEGGLADQALGWYVEALLATGGLGMLGELFHNTADQLDNGAYGRERIWSLILGPSFGTGNQAISVAAGAQQMLLDNEGKNDKEREAMRAISSRIPIAGGNAAIRNFLVDTIAGESQK